MKTKQLSRADANANYARLDAENTVLLVALSDTIRGAVHWFPAVRLCDHAGSYRLGVSRPNGAAGGIAILDRSGCVGAYYFEAWSADELAHISCIITGENTPHNRELAARRELIETARAWVRLQQTAAA